MKLELRKETTWDGKTWYHIYKDGYFVHVYSNLEDAERVYNDILNNGMTPPAWEVLKSEEIETA